MCQLNIFNYYSKVVLYLFSTSTFSDFYYDYFATSISIKICKLQTNSKSKNTVHTIFNQ